MFKPRPKKITRKKAVSDFLYRYELEPIDLNTFLYKPKGVYYSFDRVNIAFKVWLVGKDRTIKVDAYKPRALLNELKSRVVDKKRHTI
ncbi:hypothetical protein [Vibrio campbellii]|uniref:hypothetical protein n=1 Tax=Vibrio campbellii TaxID=680 RepID=UPI00168D05C9|nr:hypothetical protein [Vibrio campbellii]